jgi:hemoglobin
MASLYEKLVETFKELGISDELIEEVAAIAAAPAHKRDVLNRSNHSS